MDLGVDYSNAQVIPSGAITVVVRGQAQIRLDGTAWQATRIPH